MNNLIFRRQFLLSVGSIGSLDSNWNSHQIKSAGDSWYLYSHPDLEFTIHKNDTCTLILLGYLLDPYETDSGNQEILSKVAENLEFQAVVESTHRLNGRFLLFYLSHELFRIINDASGFRELYYLKQNGQINCGSTPDILNEYLGIESEPEEQAIQFLDSEVYIGNSSTWVGYDTIYKEIKKLPPNFLLDIHRQATNRFWPTEKLKKAEPESVAIQCGDYLRGCLVSSMNRKPIHLGVTAGWDSRVLLAATQDIKDRVFYYLNMTPEMGENNKDIRISKKLAKALGYNLNVLEITEAEVSDDFRRIHSQNNFRSNEYLLPVFYFGHQNKFDDTYTVSGNLAEGSARKYYYMPLFMNRLNGKKLARIVHFGSDKYAIQKLDEWLEESLPLCKKLDMDVLDLYQIEQEASNWCSLTASEQDIVREEIRPFNSRYLMSLFWSLEIRNRLLYTPSIYQKMAQYLWADTLDIPVNPSWKSRLMSFLNSMGIKLLIYRMKSSVKYTLRMD